MNLRALLCIILSSSLVFLSMPVHAGMIGTEKLLATQEEAANLAEVRSFVARDEVRHQMAMLGVDPAQVDQRLAALTSGEVQQLAAGINALPAGGDVGIVVILLIVLILLRL